MNKEKPEPSKEALTTYRSAIALASSIVRNHPALKAILTVEHDEEALILACRKFGSGTARRLLGCVEKAAEEKARQEPGGEG